MIIGLMPPLGSNDASSELSLLLAKIGNTLSGEVFNPGAIQTFGRRLALLDSADSSNARPRLNVFSAPDMQLIMLSDASLSSQYLPTTHVKLRPDTPLDWNLPGRWVAASVPNNEVEPILWASDPLGHQWLYFTETRHGIVFSNDFYVTCLLAPTAGEINLSNLRRALVLGYMLGEETIHPAIRLAPPGCVFEWTNGGFHIHSFHRLKYGDVLAGKSNDAKKNAVVTAFESAAEGWKKILPERTSISLSAGLDSRTALSYLRRAGLKMPCFTFGHPESVEVRDAARIAALVGTTTQVFPIPDISWNDWEISTQRLGSAGQVQMSGWAQAWLRYIGHEADALVHGYLGDALTGKHLSSSIVGALSNGLSYFTNFSIDSFWRDWPGLRKQWREHMAPELEADFREVLSGVDVAFAHQQTLHLDLYCHERLWTAFQPNFLGQSVLPACFFYHPDILQVWTNLSIADLDRQALYNQANHQAFPTLFPGQPTASFNLARRIARKVLQMFNNSLPDSQRPIVIDKTSMIAATNQQAISRILAVQDTLDKVVDVRYVISRIENSGRNMLSQDECAALIRVINVAHLLALIQK